MAHEIMQQDKVVTVGARAWHGLDLNLSEGTTLTPYEGLKLAGIDREVVTDDLYRLVDGKPVLVPQAVATRYDDSDEIMGVVGRDYRPFQNRELCDLVSAVADNAGVQIETVGSIRNGAKVWFLARTSSMFDVTGRGDKVQPYIAFLNGHDGRQSVKVLPTSVRIVCSNTFHMVDPEGVTSGDAFAFRHTGSVAAAVEAAKPAIERAVLDIEAYKADMTKLAQRPLTEAEMVKFFTRVYLAQWGTVPTDATDKGSRKKATLARQRFEDWSATARGPRGFSEGGVTTAWAAFNAVTEWADHRRTVRKTGGRTEAEARTESKVWGDTAILKAKAWQEAAALIA